MTENKGAVNLDLGKDPTEQFLACPECHKLFWTQSAKLRHIKQKHKGAMTQEGVLHQQVCDYLRINHPEVIFRTDFAAGTKLTIGQARRHKRLQQSRAFPDLFIAEARKGFHGLFVELKAKTIYKKDGSLLANPHVEEQVKVLEALQDRGYAAGFAVGFTEACEVIDGYLGG